MDEQVTSNYINKTILGAKSVFLQIYQKGFKKGKLAL